MAAGVNRERRVEALEHRKRANRPVQIPIISAAIGETSDDAVARHVAKHGPLAAVDDDQVNAIVVIPVAPSGRRAE